MSAPVKRISLMIREDQHEKLLERGINVSGLIRDLIDDYLSEHKITLAVGEDTLRVYHQVITNSGSSDSELEPYLKQSLKEMLKEKIRKMEKLHGQLEKETR